MKNIQREAGALAVAIEDRRQTIKQYKKSAINREIKWAMRRYRKALYRFHIASHDPRLTKPWNQYAPKGGKRRWWRPNNTDERLQNSVAEEARRRHVELEDRQEALQKAKAKRGERAYIVGKARQELQFLRIQHALVVEQVKAQGLDVPKWDSSKYGTACVQEVVGLWEAQRLIRDYWDKVAEELQEPSVVWVAA